MFYKYKSTFEKKRVFNDLRIEIQIRSRLQHAWATAVETVSAFTDQALKSGEGKPKWKRFFSLMGNAIAQREGCPTVPGTPDNKNELVDELKMLIEDLRVRATLNGWSEATKIITEEMINSESHLLKLDTETQNITVTGFPKGTLAQATQMYLEEEKKNANNPAVQVVLVSVDSLASLQTAYPNYYLDTKEFMTALNEVVDF
jgi:hypothetical protein